MTNKNTTTTYQVERTNTDHKIYTHLIIEMSVPIEKLANNYVILIKQYSVILFLYLLGKIDAEAPKLRG